MRNALGVVLVMMLSGCAATMTTTKRLDQGTFGIGAYRLIAVENYGLPHLVTAGTSSGIEVVSGRLTLLEDQTFKMWIDGKVQVTALEPLAFTRKYEGTYASSPMGATFIWQDNRSTTGAFLGQSLRVYRDGVEYLFAK